MSRWGVVVLTVGVSVVAVVAGGCGSESCESTRPDLCGGGGAGGGSILGATPTTYTEMNEAANSAGSGAEDTGYVLEDEQGLAIDGMFESDTPTNDAYIFNSGDFGGATEPDFPGVDVRVFVDGLEIRGSTDGISLSLTTVQYMGYSSLSGAYFINAALFSGEDYVLTIRPAETHAGRPYTIEIRGNVPATMP